MELLQVNNYRQESRTHNSAYPKGGVFCSIDSFAVTRALVCQIKFCGKSLTLLLAAKRCNQA